MSCGCAGLASNSMGGFGLGGEGGGALARGRSLGPAPPVHQDLSSPSLCSLVCCVPHLALRGP